MNTKAFLPAAALLLPALVLAEDGIKYSVHGQSWFEAGRIMSAEDTIINGAAPDNILNLQGNLLQGMGAQITLDADFTDNLTGAFGFGVHKVNHAFGRGPGNLLAITLFQNFLTTSRLTWFTGEKADPNLSLTLGAFPFKYNRDVKNLGLYLLRGPVYPGVLMGGFNDFATDTTKSTQLGFRAHHKAGIFSHDLIVNSEREIPPTFDWSIAYLAKINAGPLEIGGGANFYRWFAYNEKLQTPGKSFTDAELGFNKANYIEVGPAGDTTFFTHKGIKVMGHFGLDLQRLFGAELAHPDDMKLYGEVAVLGTQNYGTAYNDIKKRMPMMLGFNVPTGGLLTHLSLEVEYYGARYRNDLVRVGNNNTVAPWTQQRHPIPSPKPVSYADYGMDTATGFWINTNTGDTVRTKGTVLDKVNNAKDDIKWALVAEKVISNHISIMAQVANDHYRPRSVATGLIKSEGGTQEAFASPKDWYFMLRMGYFF